MAEQFSTESPQQRGGQNNGTIPSKGRARGPLRKPRPYSFMHTALREESMVTLDTPLTFHGEDESTVFWLSEKVQAGDRFDEGVGPFRGVFFGCVFSIPIWAFILWIIL
jgi:hypothetical protein